MALCDSESGSWVEIQVIVDEVDGARIDPAGEPEWSTLVGMLVLSLPEVSWSFLSVCAWPEVETSVISCAGWPAVGCIVPSPIFDGLGLRNSVRQVTRRAAAMGTNDLEHIPIRKKLSAALDEELPYAWFHSYAAYRSGYRAFALTSFFEAELLFGKERRTEPAVTALEDIYLAYPDTPSKVRLSRCGIMAKKDRDEGWLGFRDDVLPGLTATRRVFISSGHGEKTNPADWVANAEWYSRTQKEPDDGKRWIPKPAKGFFHLAKSARLTPNPDFAWPYLIQSDAPVHASHSAPPRLKAVADVLVGRAEFLKNSSTSIRGAITAAVCARDALELLGPRTPTIAVEALALAQELEVRSECEFGGVQYNFEVAPRLKDIADELDAMTPWINERNLASFHWSAEATILTRLGRIFREHGQFDEEQECLARLRACNRELRITQYRDTLNGHLAALKKSGKYRWYHEWRRVHELLKWPMAYLDWLLCSLRNLGGSIAIWILVMAIAFWLTPLGNHCAKESVWLSFQTFVAVQPPETTAPIEGWGALVVGTTMAAGYFHLGILINHIYMIISRR